MAPLDDNELDDLVGISDLAELLAPEKPMPSGLVAMRKRHPDFPEPRAMAGRTALFRVGDFLDWYTQRHPGAIIDATPKWQWRRAAQACRSAEGLDATRRFAIGFLVLAKIMGVPALSNGLTSAPADDTPGWCQQQAPKLEAAHPPLEGILGELLSAIPGPSPTASRLAQAITGALLTTQATRLADDLLAYLTGASAPAGTTTTPELLVEILLAVADVNVGDIVLDPTAGEGSLLLLAGLDSGYSGKALGFEKDEWARRIAAARLYLNGVPFDLGPGPIDSLQYLPSKGANIVVSDPPFHGKGIDRWLKVALGQTAHDGRAVVAMPVRTLNPDRREWAVLPTGTVQSIVLCPAGSRDDTNEAVAIWTLTHQPNESVLIIDASTLRLPSKNESSADEAHRRSQLDRLNERIQSWRESGALTEPLTDDLVAAVISSTDIADHNGDLRPSTWRQQTGQADSTRTVARALELADELAALLNGPLRAEVTEQQRLTVERVARRLDSRR